MGRDPQDSIIGRTLADFLVKEKLGEGGFGAVYKAIQLTLGREVVIKILHTKHRTNQEIIERFKREAHLASRLEHPYSAHIYAFGAESDGLLWIAMEYVAGTPLNEVLKLQGGIPLERFVPLLDKICEVVYTAHEAGIVHRDLKPANVMVISRAGRLLPKLLDFGIAKSFELVKSTPSKTALSNGSVKKTGLITKNQVLDITEETTVKISFQNAEIPLVKANDPDITQSDPIINQENTPNKNTSPINPQETKGKQEEFQTEGIMGSPRYMSPEQWEGAAKADARSDIYALGVIAYECLTGRAPFLDTGHAALMRAHMLNPVPALEGKFPSVLDTVISKAMAKEPIERYQTALEFAAAFRSAAGFDQEPTTLPQLNEELQDQLITTAPRPLAEAIANLASARSLYQSKDLMVRVLQILLRYLALLALTTYIRVKSEQKLSSVISSLLNQLYKQGLSEEQWWELTFELVKPFAKQVDVHPIPELVTLFFTSEVQNSEQLEIVKQLLNLKQTFTLTGSISEEQLLPQIEKFTSLLTKLLKNLVWLTSYSLAIAKNGQEVEKLMGAIRQSKSIEVKAKKLPTGQLLLIDLTGNLVVILAPLMQFLAPSIGSTNEIFFLERNGRRGAKLISWPTGFETENEAPWEWLREYFLSVGEKGQSQHLEEKSPYLGLTAFSPNDSAMFFGRERETESFLNRLRIQSLLAVVGPSGAGKSSFVQAGVIPGLPENWQSITLRPGTSPLATMSAKLSKIGIQITDLKTTLQKDIEALGKALRDFAAKNKITILIVIDQFEEVITICLNKEEQRLYVDALVLAARLEEDGVRVVLTMRDDFLVRAKELASLRDKLSQGLEILTTPASRELLRILVEPARLSGYEFDDPELPLEIVKSVTGQTSALPLLAFTAAKLWEGRDRQFKQLRRKVYEAMGGVGGALVGHAEEMMLQMTQSEQSLVREAFHHLVTSEGTRAVLTRPELVQLLGKTKDSETVLEKLISSRLLVTTEGEKGIDRIEIVHEALLSTWPRLVGWRQEMAEGARLRDQLRAAARQWQERGCPKGLLWRDDALTEYKLWRERYKGKLIEVEEDFGKTSIQDTTRRQGIRRRLLVTAISVLVVGLLVLFYQRERTQKQLIETLALYEEQGRQQMLKGNLDGAAVYLSEAYAKGANSLALRYMLAVSLTKAENHPSITLGNHTGIVTKAAFSPDDGLVVTASTDKTARIWNVKDGKQIFVLSGHKDTITFAQFSPDGKLVVTSSLDKTACVWRVTDGKLVATLLSHTEALSKAIFSPDGKQIVTASYDGNAKIWDTTGKLITTLSGHQGAIYDVCFNRSLIATAGADKTAKIWNTSGRLVNTLAGHQGAVVSIAFSPMGKMLVTGSIDNMTMLWQTDEGKLVNTLAGHQGAITDAKFSPDGKTVLTTSVDKNAYIWDAKTAKIIAKLNGHNESIHNGSFSPDGKLIITNSYDKTLRVWESATGKFLVALAEHQNAISSSTFSSNGEMILTSSADKSAKIWKLDVEKRLPSRVTEIVKEKIPLFLEEGRLVNKKQISDKEKILIDNTEQIPKIVSEKANNVYVEDLGNGIKIELVKINSGTFEMGSPKIEAGHLNDEQIHTVKLSKDFYMGRYEVTQKQWKSIAALPAINMFLGASPSGFKGDNLPVEQVNWDEAVEFCARLSRVTGKKYRLPTEAELEYASRAGNKNEYPNNLDEIAWYSKTSDNKTHIVGQKKPNAWGLYDVYGNVIEWGLDWYGDYLKGVVIDPVGVSSGIYHVGRGGSWASPVDSCRSANRSYTTPDFRNDALGFRLVMEIEEK